MTPNKPAPKVGIVVLNWNQAEDTCECLDSLRRLVYPNCGVIVVDNGSQDGSPDLILKQYPEVTLIRNDRNLGCAGGINVGIDRALRDGADHIFALNNDTVVDSNLLTCLVEAVESDPQVAVVGPQIFYYDQPEKLWFLGARVKWPLADIEIWHRDEMNPYPKRQILDSDYASAGMLIRASVVRQLGGFDPYFFIYWEDVELCTRYLRAGFKVKVVTDAQMWHRVSRAATSGKASEFLMVRNQLYFCRKYLTFFHFALWVVPIVIYRQLRQAIRSRFGKSSRARFWGIWAYLRGWQGSEGLESI